MNKCMYIGLIGIVLNLTGCASLQTKNGFQFALFEKQYIETTRPAKVELEIKKAEISAKFGRINAVSIPRMITSFLTFFDTLASNRKLVTVQKAVHYRFLPIGYNVLSKGTVNHKQIGSLNETKSESKYIKSLSTDHIVVE